MQFYSTTKDDRKLKKWWQNHYKQLQLFLLLMALICNQDHSTSSSSLLSAINIAISPLLPFIYLPCNNSPGCTERTNVDYVIKFLMKIYVLPCYPSSSRFFMFIKLFNLRYDDYRATSLTFWAEYLVFILKLTFDGYCGNFPHYIYEMRVKIFYVKLIDMSILEISQFNENGRKNILTRVVDRAKIFFYLPRRKFFYKFWGQFNHH